jgi:predicted CoA-substrate-specific enzyme activase
MCQSASEPAFAGIDVGSLTTKVVIISNDGIAGSGVVPTGVRPEESGPEVFRIALKAANLSEEDVAYLVATGYGRVSSDYADKTVTEITCHARGAYYLHPATRTIIDMGGQDCKVIRVNGEGNVTDFAMNDKCAAGTGRFLEVMSGVFKVDINEFGPMALRATDVVPISSTCTVFAESEVISLIARGELPENIISGIHSAISNRIAGMAARVGVEGDVFFSGGVAKNAGMKAALERSLRSSITVPAFDPQLVGALGAAVIAETTGRKAGA